ncbi:hypothetical protein Tco_0748719 [Tanacetum coccineum]|uniref:Uncharacterized protein n=1 Tax=Tanacetum coccineum TaxID=301880 RepID=A0ABQ4YZT6_9ASTR
MLANSHHKPRLVASVALRKGVATAAAVVSIEIDIPVCLGLTLVEQTRFHLSQLRMSWVEHLHGLIYDNTCVPSYKIYGVCIGMLSCRGLSLISRPLHAMKSQSQIQSSTAVKFGGVIEVLVVSGWSSKSTFLIEDFGNFFCMSSISVRFLSAGISILVSTTGLFFFYSMYKQKKNDVVQSRVPEILRRVDNLKRKYDVLWD